MRIEKAKIERVKRVNDLVELVRGRGIELKRKGKQLVGKCPFHDDHEPSLIVDPRKMNHPGSSHSRRVGQGITGYRGLVEMVPLPNGHFAAATLLPFS